MKFPEANSEQFQIGGVVVSSPYLRDVSVNRGALLMLLSGEY